MRHSNTFIRQRYVRERLKSSLRNVKYKRTDALSRWHQQQSNTVGIHGPLQTRGETRCLGGVSVSCLASRTRHECPRYNESIYGGLTLDVDRHYIGSFMVDIWILSDNKKSHSRMYYDILEHGHYAVPSSIDELKHKLVSLLPNLTL